MEGSVLHQKLRAYKKKYFLNRLLKGLILLSSIFLSIYLIISILEFSFRFDSSVRTVLFFLTVSVLLFLFIIWIAYPAYQLIFIDKELDDQEAAKQIGQFFPTVQDKLLNLLQLENLNQEENELIIASIEQKTNELKLVSFEKAVELKKNKKYAKYLIYPGIVILLLLMFIPSMLTESTERIIKYDKEFIPEAPFRFTLKNDNLEGFKNEDFELLVSIDGEYIPDQAYINIRGRRIKLKPIDGSKNLYKYTFSKIQATTKFHLEAAGYMSDNHTINVYSRPVLREFFVKLDYPDYINRKDETISNSASLIVPEGTKASWHFGTSSTDSLVITSNGTLINKLGTADQVFSFEKQLMDDFDFELKLKNEKSTNINKIAYTNKVIADEYPKLSVDQLLDTVLYNYMILGGNISDDYGLRKLTLNFKRSGDSKYTVQEISIPRNKIASGYFYQWQLDSLHLDDDQTIEYFLEVFDNDGINGSKSTKSQNYTFKTLSQKEISDKIDQNTKKAEKQINNSLEKAKDIKEKLENIDERLKTKQKLDWQDEKLLENLIKKKEELTKELEKLSNENQALNESREKFQKPNKKIQEKVKQLQELMEEILDEETKKLYDELKKLLEENSSVEQMQDQIEQIKNKEESLEAELERALELFKRLKMESKLDESIQKLEKLQQEQQKLSEETKDKKNKLDEISEQQEQLNKEFNELKEDINELQELNQDLKDPEPMQDLSDEENDIQEQMNESQQNLDKNKRNKASENQQNASDQMNKMKQKMEQMQAGMEMQMMQENLDDLRDIVDNLVKLSFDQEELMENFKGVKQSDPRFVTLSQQQLKIKDDSKIIQDSLLALAERVFQLSSFVTREVSAMNQYMDESVEALRDRNRSQAVSKQQFAMTSMNNLSILLDDVLQQMQQQMADAMGKPKSGKQKNQKNMPGLSDLQKELSRKIQELKKSGKSGRQLSEELAKLAAEQEMIRREMQKMQEQSGEEQGGGNGNMEKIIDQMKKNEQDLVNKRLSNELIRRQQDIVTRMLQAEDAMRERELDEEREGEQAESIERKVPPEFEEYFKTKEKEIELLRTIPIKLSPYYKKEVNEYFKRINQ